jgi:hypothetical protein
MKYISTVTDFVLSLQAMFHSYVIMLVYQVF